MATYNQENDIVGGGFGYGGGMFAMIILLVVVFWVLFRGRDGDRGHDGYGYGFGGGCGPCVQPTFKDESNFEEERNINSKLCKIDEDVWKNGCKDRETTHCENEKTRDLIRCEAEKEWMYKLNQANAENAILKSEKYSEKKFDQLAGLIGSLNNKIERLECEVPKRQPVWAECVTPITRDIDCDDRRPSRRRRCNDCDDWAA